jgi:hypothetical protein
MSPDFVSELRAELVGAAHRLHHRRIRRRRIARRAAIAAAVVAVVGLGAGLAATTYDSAPAAAGVQVVTVDGRLVLTVEGVAVAPNAVESALHDHDIDADVVAVPVGPSLVGRFLVGSIEGDEHAVILDLHGGTFTGFSIPLDYGGHLVLDLGRPARPGEMYHRGSDAFADGEPLACSDLLGQPLTAVARYVAAHPDLRIRVEGSDGGPPTTFVPLADAVEGPRARWRVARAPPRSARDVDLLVTPDGTDPGARSPGATIPSASEPCGG